MGSEREGSGDAEQALPESEARYLLQTLGSGRLLMPRTDAVDTSLGGLPVGQGADVV